MSDDMNTNVEIVKAREKDSGELAREVQNRCTINFNLGLPLKATVPLYDGDALLLVFQKDRDILPTPAS